MSSYWRNGPVLFNAMSGVDIALWDIKGKRAGMPLYQLLGGKVRHGADCYFHASGASFEEVEKNARAGMERGFRHVRVQVGDARLCQLRRAQHRAVDERRPPATTSSDRPTRGRSGSRRRTAGCCRSSSSTCARSSATKSSCCTTSTSASRLNQGINLCKALEPYRLFFLEDPFPPEDNDHFRLLRQQTSIPIAMGELFNTQHEYLPLIKDRLIDFIRIHISQIGGLSPARKVGRRSASSSACAPRGTARATRRRWRTPRSSRWSCASYNFGVHEGGSFPQETQEVFVGCPEIKNGYMLAQEQAGARHRVRREGRGQVPDPGRPAELRLLVGHDAPKRRHGHSALGQF